MYKRLLLIWLHLVTVSHCLTVTRYKEGDEIDTDNENTDCSSLISNSYEESTGACKCDEDNPVFVISDGEYRCLQYNQLKQIYPITNDCHADDTLYLNTSRSDKYNMYLTLQKRSVRRIKRLKCSNYNIVISTLNKQQSSFTTSIKAASRTSLQLPITSSNRKQLLGNLVKISIKCKGDDEEKYCYISKVTGEISIETIQPTSATTTTHSTSTTRIKTRPTTLSTQTYPITTTTTRKITTTYKKKSTKLLTTRAKSTSSIILTTAGISTTVISKNNTGIAKKTKNDDSNDWVIPVAISITSLLLLLLILVTIVFLKRKRKQSSSSDQSIISPQNADTNIYDYATTASININGIPETTTKPATKEQERYASLNLKNLQTNNYATLQNNLTTSEDNVYETTNDPEYFETVPYYSEKTENNPVKTEPLYFKTDPDIYATVDEPS